MRGRRTLPMTVAELRTVLADLPDDAGVLVDCGPISTAVCDHETEAGDLVLHVVTEFEEDDESGRAELYMLPEGGAA